MENYKVLLRDIWSQWQENGRFKVGQFDTEVQMSTLHQLAYGVTVFQSKTLLICIRQ